MKEIYKNAVKSFKDDILDRNGIQVIPVSDAKAAIKFAIIDTIRETVKECAENARLKRTSSDYGGLGVPTIILDKNSILSIADKLIKEL